MREVVVLLAVLTVTALADRSPSIQDSVSSFLKGIRELEDLHGRHLEDLLTAGSEVRDLVGAEEASREELEDDKGPLPNTASQEKAPGKDVAPQEPQDSREDSEDDDSDEDELDLLPPVRGLTSIFGLHNLFGMAKPWWTGPNVCVERDEKEEKSEPSGDDFISFGAAQFSNCINSPDKYTCRTITKKGGVVKTSTVSYRCCHGFRRDQRHSNCTKVETRPLMDLVVDLGGEKFADLIRSNNLQSELEGNVTIFMPTDSAMDRHHESMDSLNSIDPVLTNEVPLSGQSTPRKEKPFVLGHAVEGVFLTSDLTDEQVLTTLDNTTLRVNFLPGGGGVTVNCARINQTDKLTESGVVHTVQSPVPLATESLAQMLEEEKFSSFRKLLQENGLWEMMSGEKALTVFAVDNEGVDQLSGSHKMCMRSILAHHILPHTLCSAMADSGERLATLDISRSWLPFTKSGEGMIIGNNTKVEVVDKVATNGLLHVASNFTIPPSARALSEVMNRTEHGEWLGVMERSGLLEQIESTPNMTMFIPTDSAVREADLASLSKEELQDLVRYHVGNGQTGSAVSTLLEGQNLTISAEKSIIPGLVTMGSYLTVQCAPLTRVGGRVCNGLLHEINRVLRPPSQNIWDSLQEDKELTTLLKALQGTKLEEELKSGLGYPITFLAPTNAAFEELGSENVDKMLTDKDLADQVLRSHILKEIVCCSNAVPSSWPFVATAQTLAAGRSAEVNRRGDTAMFASLRATECDRVMKDGVVHLVSGVRLGRQRQPDRELIIRRPNSEIILGGF